MKTYIQPNTEIIAAFSCTILQGSPEQNESPGSDLEFSNTSNFEEEVVSTKSSLWDE